VSLAFECLKNLIVEGFKDNRNFPAFALPTCSPTPLLREEGNKG